MNKEEIIKLFGDYLDDRGMFYDFKDFIEGQGYTLDEIRMEE